MQHISSHGVWRTAYHIVGSNHFVPIPLCWFVRLVSFKVSHAHKPSAMHNFSRSRSSSRQVRPWQWVIAQQLPRSSLHWSWASSAGHVPTSSHFGSWQSCTSADKPSGRMTIRQQPPERKGGRTQFGAGERNKTQRAATSRERCRRSETRGEPSHALAKAPHNRALRLQRLRRTGYEVGHPLRL